MEHNLIPTNRGINVPGDHLDKPHLANIPADLPTSLDDRKTPFFCSPETTIYDAWKGQSLVLPLPSKSIPIKSSNSTNTDSSHPNMNILFDNDTSGDVGSGGGGGEECIISNMEENYSKMIQMLAHQIRMRAESKNDVTAMCVLNDEGLSLAEKKEVLQNMLSMAASNGEVDLVKSIVSDPIRKLINIDSRDSEGTTALIYASCFGHQDVVEALLDAGADIDKQDKNQWTALMWALIDSTPKHKTIAKLLIDHGANLEVKSNAGRSALDFASSDSEIVDYINGNGSVTSNNTTGGACDDFYDRGVVSDRLEEEYIEDEFRRRMMMESAINLEVDLENLGIDEIHDCIDDLEEGQEFVWNQCLSDQMFVFQESDLDRILDVIITNMIPQRSPSQKPVPANIIFLAARYAHYHVGPDLLELFLTTAVHKIMEIVQRYQWDMTILAFWMSNATILLHYLKKDAQLVDATKEFQLQLSSFIQEIYIYIIRDAERRMDKVMDAAMLDHETIPGFEGVHFQNEWKLFRSKPKVKHESIQQMLRPPSPTKRSQPSPRNITSLLSSTLFVLDLYDIHSLVTVQVISQLLYWLGAELFNRVMSNRKYLARTKAMQIRMNVSAIEDWARSNNRQAEHFENGQTIETGENTVKAAKRHLAPIVQLLQWLQCLSSSGDDLEVFIGTLQQLPRLTPQQLCHVITYYRAEVGEKSLPKFARQYLSFLHDEITARKAQERKEAEEAAIKATKLESGSSSMYENADKQGGHRSSTSSFSPESVSASSVSSSNPVSPFSQGSNDSSSQTLDTSSPSSLDPADSTISPPTKPSSASEPTSITQHKQSDDDPTSGDSLLLDSSLVLPFEMPSLTDMLICYGTGFKSANKERSHKYIPTVPPEFLAKLDAQSGVMIGDSIPNDTFGLPTPSPTHDSPSTELTDTHWSYA